MVAQLDGPDLRCLVIMNDNGVFGGICVVVFFLSKLCWDTSHLLVSWLVHVVIRNLLPTDHVFCLKCWLKLWVRAPGNMDQPSPPWLGMSRTMALWEADLMENSRRECVTRMSRVKINSVKNYETESHSILQTWHCSVRGAIGKKSFCERISHIWFGSDLHIKTTTQR